jgi:hypothetical protein
MDPVDRPPLRRVGRPAAAQHQQQGSGGPDRAPTSAGTTASAMSAFNEV